MELEHTVVLGDDSPLGGRPARSNSFQDTSEIIEMLNWEIYKSKRIMGGVRVEFAVFETYHVPDAF